ncbi:MAG: Wzz/FepE/Etk N-terminal domain-containing protein [Flavobacteriales bacterium]|nr:Wzz/FepE/Etk N-terminal domain-containing protein [Flavobacteriales bacterium]
MTNDANNFSIDSSNLLVLLYKWRKPLIIISVAAAIVSAAVSLMIREKYKSTTILFAVQQHSFGDQLLEETKLEDFLAYGEEEDAERLLQMLNSDRIRDKIIERNDLWSVYDIKRDGKGAKTLMAREYNDNVSAKLTKFGSIEVAVLDYEPDRAAKMANEIAAYSDTLTNQMRKERALQALHYAQQSLFRLEEEITLLEDSMKVLRQMGVYDYEEQITALSEQYGTSIAEGHPDRAQLIKDQMDFLSQYGTLYNKLELNIFAGHDQKEILKKRCDNIGIDVVADLDSKYTSDSAVPADKKSYPIRWLIVAMSTASAFIFGFIILLITDSLKRLRLEGKI